MTNSVQAAAIPFLSGRNRIINGCGRVQQRAAATYASGVGGGYGQCDRWRATNGAGGSVTMQANTINDENGITAQFIQLVAATAATSFAGGAAIELSQNIEGYNSVDLMGQPVTVSFTFRSNITGQFSVALIAGSTYSIVETFNYPVASTSQRVSLTFPAIPLAAAIPNSNASGLQLIIGGLNTGTLQAPTNGVWSSTSYISASGNVNWASTASNAIAVTKVQLEAGSVATPFERRSMAQEILFCQRYYCQTDNFGQLGSASRDSTALQAWTGPTADTGSYLAVSWEFPATMRVGPSVIIYNPHTGATGTAYAQNAAASLTAAVGQVSSNGCSLTLSSQSIAARDFVKWHASASAEL